MKFENRKTRLLLALFAGVAAVLLSGTVYQQFTLASTTKPEEVVIDFNAFPAQDVIEVSRGALVRVPVIVESPKDAEYQLKLAVVPDRVSGNPGSEMASNSTAEKALPQAVNVALDNQSIALSRQDERIRELPQGRVEHISSASLIVSAAPDAAEKDYSFILETRKTQPNGDDLVVGKIFTVKVK